MDQMTYEGWLKTLKDYELTTPAVLISALEAENRDNQRRRIELLVERTEKARVSTDWLFAELGSLLNEMNAAPDRDRYIKEVMAGRLITEPLSSIQEAEYSETGWVVEGLLPYGLAVLAAPPKSKKSWMALDLCLSVAEGANFLGFPTHKAEVLYLALEDSPRRLKERTDILTRWKPCPDTIRIGRETSELKRGLMEELESYLKENPETRLLVIDTLQKIRGVRTSQDIYGSDYEDLSKLKKLADRYGLCILVIHHTRKNMESTDPFSLISGSNGITGTADTQFVLTKSARSDRESFFHITGRDVEERDLELVFDTDTCRWQNMGTSDEQVRATRRKELEADPVFAAARRMAEQGPWEGTASDFLTKMLSLGYVPKQTNLRAIGVALRKMERELDEYANVKLHMTKGKKGNTVFALRPIEGWDSGEVLAKEANEANSDTGFFDEILPA